MPTIDEQLIASISTPAAPIEPKTEMVETPAAIVETAPAAAEMVALATPSEPVIDAPDYNKILDEISSGAFKDVETFKQSLPKISEYDRIKQERDDFEAKTKVDPYASDYVRILNELVKKGATPDQLNNFQKINSIGDIDTLSPVDAKVAKLVLIDGYKEDVARKMVAREFPIDDYEAGSDDRQITEEQLRVASNADKTQLADYKAKTSTIATLNDDAKLQALAQQQQHQAYVKQTVPSIASQINGMGEIAFKDDKGVEQGKLKFDYPAEFKARIPAILEEYFMDGQTPINNDTIQQAFKTANAAYLDENFPVLSQRIWESAYAKGLQDATNKYENLSGLPSSPEVRTAESTDAEYMKFVNGLVGRK